MGQRKGYGLDLVSAQLSFIVDGKPLAQWDSPGLRGDFTRDWHETVAVKASGLPVRRNVAVDEPASYVPLLISVDPLTAVVEAPSLMDTVAVLLCQLDGSCTSDGTHEAGSHDLFFSPASASLVE